MSRTSSLVMVPLLAASLSGCQLVEVLLPDSARQVPATGTCATYQVVATDQRAVTSESLEQTRAIIEDRVNATGVAAPIVVTQGTDLISVELPGVEDEADVDSLRSLTSSPGVVEVTPVPDGCIDQVRQGSPSPDCLAQAEPLFDGSGISAARFDEDQSTGEIVFDLELTDTAARIFDEYAATHLGGNFAIVLDGIVESAPSINAPRFGGRAQISGNFTVDQAQNLVTVLKFGPLPLEIQEVGFGSCQTLTQSSATAVASVEGPQPYGFGGRVTVSTAGFAMTLPDDWLWLRVPTDGPDPLDVAFEDPAVDPRLSSDLWAMRHQGSEAGADLIASRGVDRVNAAGLGRYYEPMCTFTVSPPDGRTLSDAVHDTVAEFDYPQVSEPRTRWLSIAGTQAVRVAIGPPMLIDDPAFATAAAVVYWLSGGSRLYRVDCGSSDTPADLWRSVIETWEWLPVDAPSALGSPSPAPTSPAHGWRLEVEEGGFAMDLPDHWWSGYSRGVIGGTWADMAASVLDGPLTRWVDLVGPSSGCGVMTGTVDARTAEDVMSGLDVDDAVSLDLPAGPALRIGPTRIGSTSDAVDDDTEIYGQAAYVIASPTRLAIIECAGLVPADLWLPVAEAFAFLPWRAVEMSAPNGRG